MSTAASFYVTGGTLRQDASSYVERQADRDLYEGLLHGEYCYVLHARQMGKSSLMVHTTARLRKEGVAVAAFELTALGQNLTVEQWYDGLLSRIGRELDLEDELEEYWLARERLSPLQRFMGALREVVLARCAGRIVLFLDEIDAVRNLPFSTDEFFAAIRECYNRRSQETEFQRLTFCLLGVATPSDLIQDTRTTPFNIGRRIELTDFTPAEAVPLARGLGRDEATGKALLERILYWTGGHPYLTQRLCGAVAEDGSVANAAGVDRLCDGLFLSPRAQERDDNLLFVRERLLKSEADRASLLDLYARVRRGQRVADDETNPLVSLLRLSGIVRVEGRRLQVRNRIYERAFDRHWVTTHMPDAELRRQQAAYHRGLVRAFSISTLLLSLITGLGLIAVSQARRADRNAAREAGQRRRAEERQRIARRYLYAAQMNLAQEALEAGNLGRAVELIEAQRPEPREEELRGFEWRYLWRLCRRGDARGTLLGHESKVRSVAVSPDGKLLASGSDDKTVRLWNIASRRLLAAFKHKSGISAVAFSPDGRLLAAGSGDGTLKLWNLATGREAATLRAPRIRSVAFSPDGKLLAAAAGTAVNLWSVKTRRLLAALKGYTGATTASLAFSPDGRTLASGYDGNTAVKLWDLASKRQAAILHGQIGYAISAAFSPDGQLLATGSYDNTVRFWDVHTRRLVATLTGLPGGVLAVSFSPDGKQLAAGSRDGTVRLFDVASRQQVSLLKGHQGWVESLAFCPDGRTLVSGSDDRTIKLWSTAPARDVDALRGHRGWVWSVAFSPDGRRLASAGLGDRTVRLWDAASGRQICSRQEQTGDVWCVAFSPDGRLLAFGSGTRVRLWDAALRHEIAVFQGHAAPVLCLAFSPNGRLLASGSNDNTARLWSIATHRELATFRGHEKEVVSVAFSPDERILATSSADSTVKLWDVASRRVVTTLRERTDKAWGVAFSPDGKVLVSASDGGTVSWWDLATQRGTTRPGHAGGVIAVAFSPDGKELVTAGNDNTVRLWDNLTRQEVSTLKGHTAPVTAAAFSPDGAMLATAGGDATVRLWRAPTLAEIDRRPGRAASGTGRGVVSSAHRKLAR